MKNTSNKRPASYGAGKLTAAWMAFAIEAVSLEKLDRLAIELDRILRARMPGGTFRGVLKDREDEIRQDAAILLVQRYLIGNRQLLNATRRRDFREVENQLVRSVSAAVAISTRRLRRHLGIEARRFRQIEANDVGVCSHPTQRTFWALPLALQQDLALQALNVSVAGAFITRRQAEIARHMITEGVSQAKAAEQLGISRQAVNQRTQPVRHHLRRVLETLEFSHA